MTPSCWSTRELPQMASECARVCVWDRGVRGLFVVERLRERWVACVKLVVGFAPRYVPMLHQAPRGVVLCVILHICVY